MSPRLLRLAPRGLFLLFLALALGASAVWLTASWLDRAARASATAARNAAAVDTVELFVARRDLQPGDVISREMLGLDIDLEADLGIDSIKRVEILAEMAQALGADAESGMPGGLEMEK
ncbi:MAG: phosphopantetheine-binding protein, partial [Thermaurantiacus sp.]